MDEPPALEMIDASVAKPETPDAALVQGINWRVLRGETWILAGAAGTGKSCLLATAAGLQRPARGCLRWFGRDVAELSEPDFMTQRRRIGLVFEGGGRLFHRLTVAENVALPMRYHKNQSEAEAREALSPVLELAGLTEAAGQIAGQLPRGLRPRVGLARALALKPELLLLDNPLAGLDPRERSWWLDITTRLARGHAFYEGKGLTVVVATDDPRLWPGLATRWAAVRDRAWILLDRDGARSGSPDLPEPWWETAAAAR